MDIPSYDFVYSGFLFYNLTMYLIATQDFARISNSTI